MHLRLLGAAVCKLPLGLLSSYQLQLPSSHRQHTHKAPIQHLRSPQRRTWKYLTTLMCCRRDSVVTSRMMRAYAPAECASSGIFFTAYCRPSSRLMAAGRGQVGSEAEGGTGAQRRARHAASARVAALQSAQHSLVNSRGFSTASCRSTCPAGGGRPTHLPPLRRSRRAPAPAAR